MRLPLSLRLGATSLTLACLLGLASPANSAGCGERGVAVQVLGSGGPAPDVGRASSGYLVWVDGKARLMIDAGGGTFLRFAESGARIEDLSLIVLTHLHTDHAGELPNLLKGGFFGDREAPLAVAGPSGSRLFPGIKDYLRSLFDAKQGSFRYLAGFLDGSDGLFALRAHELPAAKGRRASLELPDGITLDSVGVEHGPVPALGLRVRVGGKRIAFSGDQNGDNPAFAELARGADLLIMTHAIPEAADPAAARLHARPSEIGALAERAGVGRLLLSHLMRRSLDHLDASLASIRARYPGPVEVAADLQCLPL